MHCENMQVLAVELCQAWYTLVIHPEAEIGGLGGQPQPPGNSKPAWIYKTKLLVKNKGRAGSGCACLLSPQSKAGRSSEFLVYRESSGTARATQRDPVSEKKKRQNLTA